MIFRFLLKTVLFWVLGRVISRYLPFLRRIPGFPV